MCDKRLRFLPHFQSIFALIAPTLMISSLSKNCHDLNFLCPQTCERRWGNRVRFEKGAIFRSGYWFSDFLQFDFILSTILYWIAISSCHYDRMSSTTQGELILFLKNQLQLGPKYIWKHFPLCRYKVPCQLLTGSCEELPGERTDGISPFPFHLNRKDWGAV